MSTPDSVARLCRADELQEGQARGFDPWHDGHDTVLVVRHGGQLYGWHDACPHYGDTPLAWRKDAYLDAARKRIVCAAHGAQFDIASGVCTLGPCLGQGLRPVALQIDEHINIRRHGEEETPHEQHR